MALQKFYLKNCVEVGTDEAGRGCLAGPVVAAAVVLPSNFTHPLLNDSKQLTEKQRQILRQIIEKDHDLHIISKIFEFLAEGHDIERRRTLLEMKDANGRTFRYVSIKDCPNESKRWVDGKVEVRRIDEVFKRRKVAQ